MKKDLKEKLINRKIKKPNPIIMSFLFLLLRFINKKNKVNFSYDYDPKSIKKQPTILLSAHVSRLEFMYTLYGFKRKDVNMVCGYQNIIKKGLYNLFIKLGVISKYLYQPDFICLKNILRVLRRNGAVGIFPEGIQSTSGSTHPINPTTAKFIKSSKANIVVSTSKGSYLTTNRYSSDRKKGYIGVEYSLLFPPEMLEDLSEEQVYNSILEKLSYNEFDYNKLARNKYVGKKPNAFGIDKILYKCPKCKTEHLLEVKDQSIYCKACDFKVTINQYYDLIYHTDKKYFTSIDDWYKWQRKCVSQEITDKDFELTLDGGLYVLKLDKLRKSPKDKKVISIGKAKLTNIGLKFINTSNNSELFFDSQKLYSLTFSTQGYLEFYYDSEYYMIIPNESHKGLIKWTLASEEIHNLYDEKWKSASNDVYDYN